MPEQRETLSPARQALSYAGLALLGIGVLLFLSVFVTGALHFGDFNNFEQRGRSESLRAISGMVLMIVGSALRVVGQLGPAGSGVIPDPQRARRDVEPWSRAAGGVLNDALESVDRLKSPNEPALPAIRVRCRHCKALNSEAAKFCEQCGQPM